MPPLDRYKPPMSLEDSERLLKASKDREKAKNERALVFGFMGFVLCILGLIVGAFFVVRSIASLFSPLH